MVNVAKRVRMPQPPSPPPLSRGAGGEVVYTTLLQGRGGEDVVAVGRWVEGGRVPRRRGWRLRLMTGDSGPLRVETVGKPPQSESSRSRKQVPSQQVNREKK